MKYNANQILTHFSELGLKMYLVGGFLRDMFISKESKDVDLTTPHTPKEIKEALEKAKPKWFKSIFSTNKRHMTIVVRYDDGFNPIFNIEITQFRLDIESDGHKAKCKPARTLEEDLARRDFTINAIASDTKRTYDPFGGEADCKAKVLRCVTRPTGSTGVTDDGTLYEIMEDPIVRFKEDSLRVLRLFRFEARLGFKIDPDTLRAALECGVGDDISIERIRDEITATFSVPDANCSLFLERLKQLGVLKRCLPGLYESAEFCDSLEQHPVHHKEGDVWTHIKMVVHHAKPDALNRWIALLHDIAKPRTAYLNEDKKDGTILPYASYHKHDKMGDYMIRNEVGPHLCLNGAAVFKDEDGSWKCGDLIDKAARCCQWHLKIYLWSTNGTPKDKHILKVQADMGEDLHLLKNLANADHMGRHVQPEVNAFFTPVEPEELEQHTTPLIDGDRMMKEFKMEQGKELGDLMRFAKDHQEDNPGITVKELLSVVRKQKQEGK